MPFPSTCRSKRDMCQAFRDRRKLSFSCAYGVVFSLNDYILFSRLLLNDRILFGTTPVWTTLPLTAWTFTEIQWKWAIQPLYVILSIFILFLLFCFFCHLGSVLLIFFVKCYPTASYLHMHCFLKQLIQCSQLKLPMGEIWLQPPCWLFFSMLY